jgi:hypothetical protein
MLAEKDMFYRTINNVKYKTGRFNLAMRLQRWSGEWVTSTIKNEELYDDRSRSNARTNKRNELGKSSRFTFCEAREMYEAVNAGQTTIGAVAKNKDVDHKTAKRAYDLYEDAGSDGFVLYE